jgi:CTP-dependent riboflavin kinase
LGVRWQPEGISVSELAANGSPRPAVFEGKVQSGQGDASRWLSRFNAEYSRKLGMEVFPGSLNVALSQPFDWFAADLQRHVVWFGRQEYGGERDILLLPCTLRNLQGQRAFLWSTTTAAQDRDNPRVVEIVAPVGLRVNYGLRDGDSIVIELPRLSGPVDTDHCEAPAG